MTQILRRDEIGILGIPAIPTSERAFVSHVALDQSAFGAGDARVSRIDHDTWDSYDRRQQRDSIAKEPCCVGFPSYQSLGIFNRYRSSRPRCHGHQATSLTAKQLLLKCTIGPLINPLLLLHGAAVALFLQDGPQVWPTVAITSRNRRSCAHVNTNDTVRGLDAGAWDFDRHPTVPRALPTIDFRCALGANVELSPRQGQCSLQPAMPSCRNTKRLIPCALNHHPIVKTASTFRALQFSAVNQFGFQCPWRVTGLGCSFPVDTCTTISTSKKFSHALGARASGLLHRSQLECAVRMRLTKQPRQEGQRIGLIACRIQLQGVTESYGLHVISIAKQREKTKPPQARRRRERLTIDFLRSLRLQRLRASLAPVFLSGATNRHAPLTLLAPSAREGFALDTSLVG
jgi:hypothetical protein